MSLLAIIGALCAAVIMTLIIGAAICDRLNKKRKEKSDAAKREMCGRAVKSGLCPHACEICAWYTYAENILEIEKQQMKGAEE